MGERRRDVDADQLGEDDVWYVADRSSWPSGDRSGGETVWYVADPSEWRVGPPAGPEGRIVVVNGEWGAE